MKGGVNCCYQQIRGKEMPVLIACSKTNAQENNLDVGSKHNPYTQVFQRQALNNYKKQFIKRSRKDSQGEEY